MLKFCSQIFHCMFLFSSSADCPDDAESTDPGCAAGEAGWFEWLTIRVHGEVRDGSFVLPEQHTGSSELRIMYRLCFYIKVFMQEWYSLNFVQ